MGDTRQASSGTLMHLFRLEGLEDGATEPDVRVVVFPHPRINWSVDILVMRYMGDYKHQVWSGSIREPALKWARYLVHWASVDTAIRFSPEATRWLGTGRGTVDVPEFQRLGRDASRSRAESALHACMSAHLLGAKGEERDAVDALHECYGHALAGIRAGGQEGFLTLQLLERYVWLHVAEGRLDVTYETWDSKVRAVLLDMLLEESGPHHLETPT